MKAFLLALLTSVATSAAAQQAPALPAACERANSEGPAFTQNKRLCFEELSARGRYQELIDLIEVKTLGMQALEPQEQFFLGSAFFGLSHRTAARSLQCFYVVRSRGLLEEFLLERQELLQEQHTFGTTDDMKYVDLATKTLDALASTTGCEESSHTIPSLERYGRTYAIERIQGLFYKEKKDKLSEGFNASLNQLNEQTRDFVSIASSLETSYGLNQVEIDSGRQDLLAIKERINLQFKDDQFAGEPVLVKPNPLGDDSFPSFAYDQAWQNQVLKDLERQTSHFEQLIDLKSQGKIASIEQDILAAIGAQSMDHYAERKEQRISELKKLSEQVLQPRNFWTEFLAPERKGVSELQAAVSQPGQDTLFQKAAQLNAMWASGMKSFCNPARPKWYCEKGGTP